MKKIVCMMSELLTVENKNDSWILATKAKGGKLWIPNFLCMNSSYNFSPESLQSNKWYRILSLVNLNLKMHINL